MTALTSPADQYPMRWRVSVLIDPGRGSADYGSRYFDTEGTARTYADIQQGMHPKATVKVEPAAWRPNGGAA